MNELIECKHVSTFKWRILVCGVKLGKIVDDRQEEYSFSLWWDGSLVDCFKSLEAAKAHAESLYRAHLISVLKNADGDLLAEAGLEKIRPHCDKDGFRCTPRKAGYCKGCDKATVLNTPKPTGGGE
jgi:hypothetical protein